MDPLTSNHLNECLSYNIKISLPKLKISSLAVIPLIVILLSLNFLYNLGDTYPYVPVIIESEYSFILVENPKSHNL